MEDYISNLQVDYCKVPVAWFFNALYKKHMLLFVFIQTKLYWGGVHCKAQTTRGQSLQVEDAAEFSHLCKMETTSS